MLREKWKSIQYHITEHREWQGNQHYIVVNMECSIKDENTFVKTLQFFFFTLISIIEDAKLLADIEYLTQFKHTGNLEVYHSVINKYSPKRLHFSL